MFFLDLPPMLHFDLCGYLSISDIKSLRLCCTLLRTNLGRRLSKLKLGRPRFYCKLLGSLRSRIDHAFHDCKFTLPSLQWSQECDVLYQVMNELTEALFMAQPYLLGTRFLRENLGFNVDWGGAHNGVQYVTNECDPRSAVVRVVANPEQTRGILFDLTCLGNVFGRDDEIGCVAMVGKTIRARGVGELPPNIPLINEVNKYSIHQRDGLHAFCLFRPMRDVRKFVYHHQLGPLEYGQAFRPGIFNMI